MSCISRNLYKYVEIRIVVNSLPRFLTIRLNFLFLVSYAIFPKIVYILIDCIFEHAETWKVSQSLSGNKNTVGDRKNKFLSTEKNILFKTKTWFYTKTILYFKPLFI